MREIEPPANLVPLEIDMPITSGVDVVGKIVDPNGKPLSGAVVDGLIQYQGWSTTKDDTFRVQGYYLDQPRELFFHHPERNLAGYFKLEQSPATDLTIKLLPATAIRGRLIDQQGQPLAGIQISAAGVPYKDPQDPAAIITTGTDGRFEIRGLVAGHKYKMNARGRGIRFGDLVGSGELVVDAAAAPDQTKDLGDVPLQAQFCPDSHQSATPHRVPLALPVHLRVAGKKTLAKPMAPWLPTPRNSPNSNSTTAARYWIRMANRSPARKNIFRLLDSRHAVRSIGQTACDHR